MIVNETDVFKRVMIDTVAVTIAKSGKPKLDVYVTKPDAEVYLGCGDQHYIAVLKGRDPDTRRRVCYLPLDFTYGTSKAVFRAKMAAFGVHFNSEHAVNVSETSLANSLCGRSFWIRVPAKQEYADAAGKFEYQGNWTGTNIRSVLNELDMHKARMHKALADWYPVGWYWGSEP